MTQIIFISFCMWLLLTKSDLCFVRYVERFRHGQPQSREERHQVASASGEEQAPFWWMSHSSLSSSTPTKTTDEGALYLQSLVYFIPRYQLLNSIESFCVLYFSEKMLSNFWKRTRMLLFMIHLHGVTITDPLLPTEDPIVWVVFIS